MSNYISLAKSIPATVKLIPVSKTHKVEEILEVFNEGASDFGENKVQELISKYPFLPKDIRWHLIGHLQTNKVKLIAPFIHLIQSVDSLKLLTEINNQAARNNRIIDCLLQIYIASEETKYGLDKKEALDLLSSLQFSQMGNVRITGLMGMATFTEDTVQVRKEFHELKNFFDEVRSRFFNNKEEFSILSMGMSGDYKIAIEEGSTMVRIGTAIFGERNYKKM
ncbi:MAG TPA: YggS family pyridoxal phosphate-dependent enzyme [Lentimicrobium sp.]|nr:YggS family pyridoxal phosphate-dependent enzyme [Lentimicrobium sp.]